MVLIIDSLLLDVSNYDATTFDAKCLYNSGVRRVIIGCNNEQLALEIGHKANAAGIKVIGTYCFLYYGLDGWRAPKTITATAIRVAKAVGAPYVWLDCEADVPHEAPNLSPPFRISETQACVDMIQRAGLRAGIYTGAYYWPKMGYTTVFKNLPLWVANFGSNNPTYPRAALTLVNFGGWTSPDIHQYNSTIIRCGRERDHNYLLKNLPGLDSAGEVKDLTYEETYDLFLKLIGEVVPNIVREVIVKEALEQDEAIRSGAAATNILLRAAGEPDRLLREKIAQTALNMLDPTK